MKTIESMSELKKVYDKPQMEVEEMEVQWAYLGGGKPESGGGGGTDADPDLC